MAKFAGVEALDVRCPRCQSQRVVKRDKRPTGQRFYCMSRSRAFRHGMP